MPKKCFIKANIKMNYLKNVIFIFSLILLTACGSRLLTVHKIDVQQGNALDVDKVDQITIGMSKEQVRYVLGSPIITDSFHPDRWDYVYFLLPGYGERQRKQLTLIFDRDEVIDIAKHNIIKDDSTEIKTQQDENEIDNQAEEDKLSEREKRELEEAEEQASSLQEALETNKNPNN